MKSILMRSFWPLLMFTTSLIFSNGCYQVQFNYVNAQDGTANNKYADYQEIKEAQYFRLSLNSYKQLKLDIETLLPIWKETFQEFGQKYSVPWALIAAVAYQESKWNNDSLSPTGVKGLMQITQKTAEYIGLQNRENPYESIKGGAFYLRYLYEKTPPHLPVADRWILALAAYNIGFAHLRDLHLLAQDKNFNSYQWAILKKLLIEKTKPENKNLFKYGLARGYETIGFVENVIKFQKILSKLK